MLTPGKRAKKRAHVEAAATRTAGGCAGALFGGTPGVEPFMARTAAYTCRGPSFKGLDQCRLETRAQDDIFDVQLVLDLG